MMDARKSAKLKRKRKNAEEMVTVEKETSSKKMKLAAGQSKFEKPMKLKKKSKNTKSKKVDDKSVNKTLNNSKTDKNAEISKSNKDPKATKKPKAEQLTAKEREIQRKGTQVNFQIANKAKKLWEVLRREDCPKAKQIELANEVYNLMKGKIDPLAFAHDTARVIECLMICGTPEIRNNLFEETKDKLLNFMKSKYAKFLVMKFLKYGSKFNREKIMQTMHGKVVKLVLHTEASETVELAYNDYANVQQRNQLTMEFYGRKYALFKDNNISSFAQIVQNEPLEKGTILAFMKQCLTAIIEKNVIRHSIVHHVLLEYLKNCSTADREEMIVAIREKVVEILHTKDGSRIGLQCVWNGTAKDRKAIIKSLRGHAVKVAMEENGYFVLLAILDCVDDTKLVTKVLVEELLHSCTELALHLTGRKVLLHLIAPRNTTYFHPDVIKLLSEGDNNPTSKKEPAVRRQEYLEAVSDSIFNTILDKTESWIACPGVVGLIEAVIKFCKGDVSKLFTRIAELASKPLTTSGNSDSTHIVENAAGHYLLKRLIKEDKERAGRKETILFSEIFVNIVPEECLQSWIHCNRGGFILLALIESENIPVIKKVTLALKPVMDALKKKKLKSTELLHLKLKSIDLQ